MTDDLRIYGGTIKSDQHRATTVTFTVPTEPGQGRAIGHLHRQTMILPDRRKVMEELSYA